MNFSIRYFSLLLFLICIGNALSAQYVYTIKADSVKITNCDSAELIIENHTQGVPGFLFNTGNGRTIFKRALMQLDDSTYLLGGDTLRASAFSLWKRNGNHIYNINTGNVGIHRTSPNVMLDLPGPINIDDTSAYHIHYHPVLRLTGWRDTAVSDIFVGPLGAYTNLMIGDSSGRNSSAIFSTFVGNQAGENNTGDGNTFVGYASGHDNGGLGNTFVGYNSGYNNSSDGTFVGNAEWNSFFGSSAGYNSSGQENTFVGAAAGADNSGTLNQFVGDQCGAASSGTENSFFGSYCGWQNMGDYNCFWGNSTGSTSLGNKNIFLGYNAAVINYGDLNVIAGYYSGYNNVGNSNCFLGDSSGFNNNGNNNVLLGVYSGVNSQGNDNVFLGDSTGFYNNSVGGDGNTLIGARAGVSTYANGLTLIGTRTNAAYGIGSNGDPIQNATALGAGAVVNASNTIVFGDANVNSWLFNTNAASVSGAALVVGYNSTNGNGAHLTTGGVWTNASDRFKKENFETLDNTEILDKIGQLPITRWNYKGLSEQHIGPVAQDFYQIFRVGTNDKTISTIDPSGIALAGIQGLYLKCKNADAEIQDLRAQLEKQQAVLATQQAQINQLLEKLNVQK